MQIGMQTWLSGKQGGFGAGQWAEAGGAFSVERKSLNVLEYVSKIQMLEGASGEGAERCMEYSRENV